MKNTQLKNQQGIGLIEVLITTLVIAVGLLAVASLQSSLMTSSGESKIRSEAMSIANQKIEELKSYTEIGTLVDVTADGDINDDDQCVGANIGISGYYGICQPVVVANVYPEVSTDAGSGFTGTNAVFTRTWDVVEGGGTFSGPRRKKISVQVSWDGNGDAAVGTTDEERVVVVTEIAWVDPAKSAQYAVINKGGTKTVPSPRQNASEDVDAASESVLGVDATVLTGTPGTTSGITISAEDPNNSGTFYTITIYQIAPNSHYYSVTTNAENVLTSSIEPGVIAVYLCKDAETAPPVPAKCTHIQNHFGGVVLRHSGTVYSVNANGLDHISVGWTSSAINACYIGARTTGGGVTTMPYECVYAGNCNSTAVADRTRTATGAIADASNFYPACYRTGVVSDAQINARKVGPGGEFGDVGLLGLVDSTGGGQKREEVCFLEDVSMPKDSGLTQEMLVKDGSRWDINNDFLFPVTKRFYVARRIEKDGTNFRQISEGVNRSYMGHNFLIIERKASHSNDATGTSSCHQIAVDTIGGSVDTAGNSISGISLAPRTIVRLYNEESSALPGKDNVVKPEITQAYHYFEWLSTYNPGTLQTPTIPDVGGTVIGGAIVTMGDVTADNDELRLYIEERGSCYLNVAKDTYACVTAPYVRSVFYSFDGLFRTRLEEYVIDSAGSLYDGLFYQWVDDIANGTFVATRGPTNLVSGGSLTYAGTSGVLALFATCVPGDVSPPPATLSHDITKPDTNCVWKTDF